MAGRRSSRQRAQMYVLLCAQLFTNFVVRYTLPPLQVFLAAEQGAPEPYRAV